MKSKQKIDFFVALLLIVIGMILLILPLVGINDLKNPFNIVLTIYSIIGLIQFILVKKSKDYEGLYISISSIIALIFSKLYKSTTLDNLAMTLMIWIILISFTKLKKADYYNDHNDRMWKLNVLTLLIFIITGILTAFHLAYEPNIQEIVLGFFLMINGILKIIDPVVKTLIKHS